ncbi:MAG: sodium:calcium symporter, partial [Candidatus Omnitrophica bacterium]|nr:sodium:calcium symporter [Candidatus Omnitrophota bacterium]
VEAILFGWVFGIDKAWEEIHHGADLRIPRIYKFIIKYVTPTFLLTILCWWFFKEWLPLILMKGVAAENRIYILITRIILLVLFLSIAILVRVAWKKKAAVKRG